MSRLIHRHTRAFCLGVLLAAALPAVASAEEASAAAVKALQQKLDQSIQMIEALTARVKELEVQHATTATAAAARTPVQPPALDSTRLQAVEQQVNQIETANAARQGDDTGLPVHGFADVNIGTHNPFNPNEKGASVNNFDLYLTPRLGDKWLSLVELNFEVDSAGDVGVDMERAQLGYQFSDAATAWVGRFHTPYGYVNTAFHHGVWLNDSLRRPAFLGFEDQGGVLPAHTIGAWLTGAVHGEGSKLLYDAFAGNAQQIIDGQIDMRTGGNDHGKLIYGGRVGYQWTAGPAEGLLVGVNAFDSKIDDDQLPQNLTDVRVAGAYAVYDTDTWEVLSEVYWFSNINLYQSVGTHRSNAYFAQVGYRLPNFVPYARYERTNLDQTDQYFAHQLSGGSYYRSAVGFRRDLNQKVAFKIEVANTHYTDRIVGHFNEFLSQLAVRF